MSIPSLSSFIPSRAPVIICASTVAPTLFLHQFPYPINLEASPVGQGGYNEQLKHLWSHAHVDNKNGSQKNWRGPNTLRPKVLQSWRKRIPRVLLGGCVHVLILVVLI